MIFGAASGGSKGTFKTGLGAGAALGGAAGPGVEEAGGDAATAGAGVGELFAARAAAATDRAGGAEPAGTLSGCAWTAGEGELCGCTGRLHDCRQSKTKPM
jgi:hypothetical protein